MCDCAGNVSVGNLPKFLPFVLQEIENQPKRQYLLLHSLKEVGWESSPVILIHHTLSSCTRFILINHPDVPVLGSRGVKHQVTYLHPHHHASDPTVTFSPHSLHLQRLADAWIVSILRRASQHLVLSLSQRGRELISCTIPVMACWVFLLLELAVWHRTDFNSVQKL